MKEDYVSYELAKELKECGFNEPCSAFYRHIDGKLWFSTDGAENWNSGVDFTAPHIYHAQKWLREKKRIAINVIAHDTSDKYREGKYHWEEVYLPNFSEEGHQWTDWFIYGKHPLFDTYEEALSDGLSQMLGLIKKGE